MTHNTSITFDEFIEYENTHKACSKCGHTKHLSEFPKKCSGESRGHISRCKRCKRQQEKQWASRNKSTIAKYAKRYSSTEAAKSKYAAYKQSNNGKIAIQHNHLKKCYGLSPEQYAELVERSNNKCELCGGSLVPGKKGGRSLVVDHDHDTGRVRGLIHSTCNSGLGMFNDDIAMLKKAILYLEQH